MVRISDNPSAFNPIRSGIVQDKINRNIEKLSTGKRINRARDDAAGSAISQKMTAQVNGLRQAAINVQDGISLLQTAEGGLREVQSLLQRGRTLAVQAANDTLTDTDRAYIQTEINEILNQLDQMVSDVQFNGKTLLSGINNADVVVVVDNTGSMNAFFAPLVTALQNFASTLAASGIRLRLGLAVYGDDPTAPNPNGDHDLTQPLSFINLTSDTNSIINTIGGLVSGGGADLPESGLEALEGSRNLGFLQNSQKNILLVTDAGFHDANDGDDDFPANGGTPVQRTDFLGFDDGESNFDIDQVIADLNQDGIRTSVLGRVNDFFIFNGPLESHRELAADTGGRFGEITDVGNYSNFLAALSSDIINAAGFPINIQIGPNSEDVLEMDVPFDARRKTLGLTNVDVTTRDAAEQAIDQFTNAINNVSEQMASAGAIENRLESAFTQLNVQNENLSSARSRIEDADVAAEVIGLTKNQIILDTGLSAQQSGNSQFNGLMGLFVNMIT